MKYFYYYLFFDFFCILCVLSSVSSTESDNGQITSYVEDSEIVDPNSLYYNPNTQKIRIPKNYKDVDGDSSTAVVSGDDDLYQAYCKGNPYELFARRLINMLILKSNFKVENGIALGQLDLEATIEELNILRGFGEGKISIRKVDSVIGDVIRATQVSLFDEALNFTDRVLIYLYQHRTIFGFISLSLFVILIAIKVQWTRLKIIILLLDIMVIISFVLTWWELLQESKIKLTAQQSTYSKVPAECLGHGMNFYKFIMSYFGYKNDDCLKYYEAIMTDPILKVTPLHAFSHMCSKFFFYPLSVFGHSMSDFIEHITLPLPVYMRWIAKVILVIFTPLIIGILFIVILGGSMGLRIGPFFHVYLHGKQSTSSSDSLANSTRQTIEVIQSESIKKPIIFSTKGKSITSTKKETSNKVKDDIQFLDINNRKQEESDTNSDEFPEEQEYEKVSQISLEDGISESNDNTVVKYRSFEKEKVQDKKHKESQQGKKTSLEIGSGDG